jgi:HK97 family phage prohead protease
MSKAIQYKSFSLKLDDVDSQGTIRGYASTFGNVDLGMDVVDKGAFKKSIRESSGLWPILADHNPSKQIGWNMRAEEDEKGLYIEGKLDMNVQDAREKYSLAKTAMELGAAMGLSIGYMVVKAEPDREKPMVRRLKELKLFEYSIVTFPMNTEAMITSAKGLVGIDRAQFFIKELEKQGINRDEIEKALRGEAAQPSQDPKKTLQSMDDLIKMLKS